MQPFGSRMRGTEALPYINSLLGKRRLVVIANREPYIHQRKGDAIELIRPASGLVTALEPVLRRCGGLWLAHGSGTADHETATPDGEIRVPPENPTFLLKRVWLTPEEEAGYYYGFANEGLWPMCHLAHTRPTFRLADWRHYQSVNERFVRALPDSALGSDSLIMVQDYHFALAPRLIRWRRRRFGAGPRIALFWHIPWPNAEAFGICPWGPELLRGLLGADVLGFHTQFHCNNFLETCDRYLEARIDRERFSVTVDRHETLVRAFPIGIDTDPVRRLTREEREELKKSLGIQTEFVAVGVDRIDYTKGLCERIESVTRFLERYPEFVGRFTFVQIGAPSRTTVPAYRQLNDDVRSAVARANERFAGSVIFLERHHEWSEIQYFYQLGDLCMVTSLHDGMNLVAKEYVWCQAPERGNLILSKFTGAARELSEALIVNPYSIEEMADAIATALRMPAEERARRMRAMRERIEANSAFHWAANIIETLAGDSAGLRGWRKLG